MTNFNINSFGNLTTGAGKKLEFKDFDKNNDGKISEDEYKSVLKEVQLDEVEMSIVDKNNDKMVDQDEFKSWENKIEMQKAVNDMAGQIAVDFVGDNASKIKDLQTELKDFIEEYSNDNTGDKFSIEEFKKALEIKYNELKENLIQEKVTTEDIINRQIDGTIELIKTGNLKGDDTIDQTTDPQALAIIGKELTKLAQAFVQNYKGDDLETALMAYLHGQACNSDQVKVMNARYEYNTKIEEFREDYSISSKELNEIKNIITDLLNNAIKENVFLNVAGKNIASENAITDLLKRYNSDNIKDLIAEVDKALNSLSDETLVETTLNKLSTQRTQSLKGSDLLVDTNTFDYSKITIGGISYQSGENYKIRKNGKEGAKEEALNTINNDQVKGQIKTQLIEKLKKQNIPFDAIENVFGNVFNEAAEEAIAENITGKHSTMFRSSESSINVKDVIDTLIRKFNEKISKAIDEMNISDKDMDLQDLDYSVLNEQSQAETANSRNTTNDEINYQELLFSGKDIPVGTVLTKKKDDFLNKQKEKTNKLIDKLKPQMLAKAKAMCVANGVEFNEKVFNSIFNNAKGNAANNAFNEKSIKIASGASEYSLNIQKLVNDFTTEFKKSFTQWVNSDETKK